MKLITMPRIFLGLASLILILDFPVPEKGWGLDNPPGWTVDGMYTHCKSRNKSKKAIEQCCLRKVDDCNNECNRVYTKKALDACKNRCRRQFNFCEEKTSLKPSGFQAPRTGGVKQTPPPSPFKSQFNIQTFMRQFSLRSRGIETLPPLVIPDPIPPALPNFELEKKTP